METINNQVAIIENSIEVLKTGPEILQANQIKKNKAIEVGNNILAAIDQSGMDQVLDERAMKYLANVSAANTSMKEQRAGVTQIMDQLKKMFTEVENEIDPKKQGTVPARIQGFRDEYAKKVFAEQEAKRREAERVAAKAKEEIDIKYQMAISYTSQYNNYLLERKRKMVNGFNAITYANFGEKSEKLKSLTFDFAFKCEGPYASSFRFHSDNELKAFAASVISENADKLSYEFMSEMSRLKDELIDKLPSKLAELTEAKRIADEAAIAEAAAHKAAEARQIALASANAAQKRKLEVEANIAREVEERRLAELKVQQEAAAADQKRREEEEKLRMTAEAAEANAKAEQEAELKKQGDQTMIMFDQEASLAEMGGSPDARQGFDLTVLHAAGYVQIFQFWFEKEGKNLPLDKMGNTKLDQMAAFCEKIAHKTGEKIESKFLKYESSFKAINKKAKL